MYAQDATAEHPTFLFVQTAAGGVWEPDPDEDGRFLLRLTDTIAHTVYFSDRPERITGVVPTGQFLDALGFTPVNPPNAALVAQTNTGEEVVIVELFDPVYNETDATLVYRARLLADYDGEGLGQLGAQRSASLPEDFGPASLFIDDCPDSSINCWKAHINDGGSDLMGTVGPMGFCWDWSQFCCQPCGEPNGGYWSDVCNHTFGDCDGRCYANGICIWT